MQKHFARDHEVSKEDYLCQIRKITMMIHKCNNSKGETIIKEEPNYTIGINAVPEEVINLEEEEQDVIIIGDESDTDNEEDDNNDDDYETYLHPERYIKQEQEEIIDQSMVLDGSMLSMDENLEISIENYVNRKYLLALLAFFQN